MVGPDLAFRLVAEIVALAAREVQQREIDGAVAHIDRRADRQVFAAMPLKAENLAVEFRRLVEVADANREVTQPGHDMPPEIRCIRLNAL